jgi:NitT/TauT family transport system ATP-binding protein
VTQSDVATVRDSRDERFAAQRSFEAPRTANAMPLIEIDQLTKTYQAADGRPVKAVDTVTETIAEGEFISILGPSGCGKSTLMMMIAGLLPATAGEVRYRGAPISGPQLEFGVVFQDPILFPWRNVMENVKLPAEVRGIKRAEQIDQAQAMINLVGLKGFETKYPNELSGGMQHRVAIARAFTLSPKLILMDEPFGALDAMTREQMNLELQRISLSTGATVIFVTHSIAEAAFLSDRVFVMSGRPSTVRAALPIDIPRPRRIELMNTDLFGEYVTKLRGLLGSDAEAHP